MSEPQNILSYTSPTDGLEPLTAEIVVKRAGMWTLLLSGCAIPSFLWAVRHYDMLAIILGILIFAAIYTFCSCTTPFRKFYRIPHVRPTLYVGYTTRLVISILFPVGMFLDLWPGFLSTRAADYIWGRDNDFVGTLVTTIVQGAILNVIVFAFMLVVYTFIYLMNLAQDRKTEP